MYSLLKPDFNVNKQTNGVMTDAILKAPFCNITFKNFTGK